MREADGPTDGGARRVMKATTPWTRSIMEGGGKDIEKTSESEGGEGRGHTDILWKMGLDISSLAFISFFMFSALSTSSLSQLIDA